MRIRPWHLVPVALAAGILVVSLPAALAADKEQNKHLIDVPLTGSAEIPSPGSPNGSGRAQISVEPNRKRVCWNLWATGIDTPTAAHIHAGYDGEAGPVVIPLTPPVDGFSTGCLQDDVETGLIKGLMENPGGYYVNIHTAKYPAGALRGQLGVTATDLQPKHGLTGANGLVTIPEDDPLTGKKH